MVAIPPKEFVSRSQAGQDRFVFELLGRDGTFLDIGSNHPIIRSNSFALEEQGWRGLCVDNSGEAMLAHEKERGSHFYLTDAASPQNWQAALAQAELPTDRLDYLSADIDGATLDFLRGFPLRDVRFRVMTVETDVYRNGLEYRDTMRRLIFEHGYELIAGDVKDQGLPFEDWWVGPELAGTRAVERFRSNGKEWRELLP